MKKTANNRKYKLLALVSLCLIAVLCLASCAASGGKATKADDANGTCGTSVVWKYTSADKTLTVSGVGDMTDYSAATEVPWYAARHAIETLKVESGVTSVGSYAFYCLSEMKTMSIADSVTKIGNCSFALCSMLESADLPSSLVSIGNSAFEACASLKNVKVPSSVSSLGDRAFAFCSKLENVYLLGAVEKIGAETFYNCVGLKNLMLNPAITADKVSADAFKSTEFTYEKASFATSLDATSTVTVEYVFEDGSAAGDKVVFENLALGEAYSINTPAKEGYTADVLTVSGVASGKDASVKVTYKKLAVEESAPAETTVPENDEGSGGKTNYVAIIIMVVVIIGICVATFFIIRAEKKENQKKMNQNKAKNRKQK